MNTAQMLNDIEQLPPEAQHQIEEFISFIKMRYEFLETKRQPEMTLGDKTINPSELFGLWAEQPRNLADIRKNAWQR
jgi:hypothetical protein